MRCRAPNRLPRVLLKLLILFVGMLAFCVWANRLPRVDEWDKGEHYKCVACGFPFVCYARCDVTYPARMTRSGKPETELNNEWFSVGLTAANGALSLLLSIVVSALIVVCSHNAGAVQISALIFACTIFAAVNCWHHLAVNEISLTRTNLLFTAGFPFRFCDTERETNPSEAIKLVNAGWPYNKPYFRIMQKPRYLTWNVLLCGTTALLISTAFVRRH